MLNVSYNNNIIYSGAKSITLNTNQTALLDNITITVSSDDVSSSTITSKDLLSNKQAYSPRGVLIYGAILDGDGDYY